MWVAHVAAHHRNRGRIPTAAELRIMTKVELLWQGDPLTLQKSFGKLHCRLCMKERIVNLKYKWCQPCEVLNSSQQDVMEPCKHVASFPRLRMGNIGADDA